MLRAANLHMQINFQDGTSQLVLSEAPASSPSAYSPSGAANSSWMATTASNPIRYTHLYHGEIYDARLENAINSTFAASSSLDWTPATPFKNAHNLGSLVLHNFPPVGVAERMSPVASWDVPAAPAPTRSADGAGVDEHGQQMVRKVFDFGNNFAGVTEVTLEGGRAGAVVTLRHAEIADVTHHGPIHNAYCEWPCGTGQCLDQVLGDGNCANQTDQYTLGAGAGGVGGGTHVWSPLFTYHGFR